MKERPDFRSVLYNCDDQVIVRQLLMDLVPAGTKDEVVDRFNGHVREYNERVARLNREAQP